MEGLKVLPAASDLQQAYSILQNSRAVAPSDELVLMSQWARFDPRLAEQLVDHFRLYWSEINPLQLNLLNQKAAWPAALGVLLDQVRTYVDFKPEEKHRYTRWAKCVMVSVRPAAGELFFIGQRSFAGKLMRQDSELSLRSYVKWGYLGRDILFNKANTLRRRTSISPSARMRALRELLQSRKRITVSDYVDALHGGVSRRQAQLDLKKAGLREIGQTRNRFYVR